MSYSNNMIADLDPNHKAFCNIAGVFLDMPIGLYSGPHANDFCAWHYGCIMSFVFVVSIKFVSVFVKNLKNALQCKCHRRNSRCLLPVWWSMDKAYFLKPRCSTSWALETEIHPRLLPLLLFGLPAVCFMFYSITMQCFLMYKFRHNTLFLVLNALDYSVHKRPHQTIVFIQSEDSRSKDLRI